MIATVVVKRKIMRIKNIVGLVSMFIFILSGQAIAEQMTQQSDVAKQFIERNGVQLVVEQEDNQNMVYGPWYLELIKKLPENVVLVDVRESKKFASGHLPNGINIPFDENKTKEFTQKVMALGKTVILNCTAGALATESMMAIVANGGDLNKIFFLDANIECSKKNECKIEINDPI